MRVTQPWATLIARGRKRLETRQWAAAYVDKAGVSVPFLGKLIIHSGRHIDDLGRRFAQRAEVREALGGQSVDDLPCGSIIGWVELASCYLLDRFKLDRIPAFERRLGDFRPGRWVWVLRDPHELIKPVHISGDKGLWLPPVDFTDTERYPAREMDL